MSASSKAEIAEFIKDALEQIGSPPEKNCSCHICPPCSDCTDNEWTRDLVARGKAILEELNV